MRARLTVRWVDRPTLLPDGGVSATYVLRTPDGTESAPVPVGDATTVPAGGGVLTPAQVTAWGTRPWTLVVTLRYTGAGAVVVPPAGIASAPVTGLGTVAVELAQIRDGGGTP